MPQPANTLHRYQIAATRPGISQRVKNRDPGAEQRRSFVGGKIVGHKRNRFGRDDHIFGVTSVKSYGGDLLEFAVDEVSAAAGIALEAVSAMPSHADALAGLPESYVG